MDAFDRLIARIETLFETWLKEFEARPISSGVRALMAFVVLRFIYRRIIRG